MIRAKVTKAEFPYHYDIDDMKNVYFEHCTLGKYAGKEFIVDKTNVREFKVISKEMGGFSHPVIIPTEIEYSEEVLIYKEVFFDFARKAKFAIEDGTVFEGYSYDESWNGWFVPYGTKETVENIAKEFEFKKVRYDENKDDYYFWNEDEEEEECFAVGEGDCQTEDGIQHIYRIGDGWIWSEVKEYESDEDA